MALNRVIIQPEIPHEPDEWMKMQKLSWSQLEIANEVFLEKQLKRFRAMGGDVIAHMQKLVVEDEREASQPRYDKAKVLEAGILEWSYNAKVTPQNIAQLDPETADWAYNEILALNQPRTEEETKNA